MYLEFAASAGQAHKPQGHSYPYLLDMLQMCSTSLRLLSQIPMIDLITLLTDLLQ